MPLGQVSRCFLGIYASRACADPNLDWDCIGRGALKLHHTIDSSWNSPRICLISYIYSDTITAHWAHDRTCLPPFLFYLLSAPWCLHHYLQTMLRVTFPTLWKSVVTPGQKAFSPALSDTRNLLGWEKRKSTRCKGQGSSPLLMFSGFT